MPSVRGIGWLAIAVLAAWTSAQAEVRLLLKDGQILRGSSVEHKESFYLLTLATEHVLPIPEGLVLTVEVADDPETLAGDPNLELSRVKPETLAGDPAATLPRSSPQVLAGDPDARLPTWADQTRVLADGMSTFRRSVIDPYWYPTSGLGKDVSDFNPVRWYQAPIDSIWWPTSALGDDVSDFNPVHWYQAPIDPIWWPSDGFSNREPSSP